MKKTLIYTSVILNAVFIIVAVWAYLMLPIWLDDTVVKPMYERWTTFFEEFPVQEGDIVFLGDSITEGAKWDEMFPDADIKNRGINGDTTTGVLARLAQISAGKPAKVFINIGTNDIAGIVNTITDARLLQNYGEILDHLKTDSPETYVYVHSLLPRAAEFQQRIETLNVQLRSLAFSRGATYINLYPHFLDDDGSIKNELSNDELHLLGRGYMLWKDIIHVQVLE